MFLFSKYLQIDKNKQMYKRMTRIFTDELIAKKLALGIKDLRN